MREYAVYKGEIMIAIGTAEECAEELNVKPNYIRWMTNPSVKRRHENRKNPDECTTAVRLDD